MKKRIVSAILFLIGIVVGAGIVTYQRFRQHEKDCAVILKNDSIIKMFNQWLTIKQEGKAISDYFEENNYKKIAIYGMGYAGSRLLDDLKGTDIEVVYAVDRKVGSISAKTELISKEEILKQPEVDAIVVTAITFFTDIEEELCDVVDCPIISLEDIIFEVQEK